MFSRIEMLATVKSMCGFLKYFVADGRFRLSSDIAHNACLVEISSRKNA